MFVRSYDLLKDLKFDLIICDEGHRLKNSNIKAAVVRCLNVYKNNNLL